MVAIFAIGVGLTNVFGRMVGNEKQGWAILAAMMILFLAGVATAYWAEAAGNPQIAALGVDTAASPVQAGGNMEGKEVRLGIANSALWATVTTATSCGAVNSMHDSYMPLGGMVPLVNMLLGEVIVGGVGSGLYGILLFAILHNQLLPLPGSARRIVDGSPVETARASGLRRFRPFQTTSQTVPTCIRADAKLSSATSRKPWRLRRPSALLARRRSGGPS